MQSTGGCAGVWHHRGLIVGAETLIEEFAGADEARGPEACGRGGQVMSREAQRVGCVGRGVADARDPVRERGGQLLGAGLLPMARLVDVPVTNGKRDQQREPECTEQAFEETAHGVRGWR